jgi:FAD/FMN-containing dehydrogenase
MNTFTNWSGTVRFTPRAVEQPEDETSVVKLVEAAAGSGGVLRPVGSGHSSAPLVETRGTLVSIDRLAGLTWHDGKQRARLGAGTTIHQAGEALLDIGLAMENTGDIDRQTLAAGFATGTHGTGRRIGNLSTQLVGVRLVTGTGEVREVSADDDDEDSAELLRAVRVSLGAAGIATSVTLRVLPAFRAHRVERCLSLADCLERLDELVEGNRNFDFYWYPRRDEVKVRTVNIAPDDRPDVERRDGPFKEIVGWSNYVLPRSRHLRFHEMEYHIPAPAGPACFQQVREWIQRRHVKDVAWRVLYRTIAADDAHLSPAHGRDTVTISLHQNQDLPYWRFFTDIEPIFLSHAGRPHWGKLHTLTGDALLSRYPLAERWLQIRKRLDPQGIFLTPYLRELLGVSR